MKDRKKLITLLITTILLLSTAGCAAAGLDNGSAGTNGTGNTSTAAPTVTSNPIEPSTTQPMETGTDIPGPEWSVALSVEMQETVEAAIRKLLGDECFKLVLEPELWSDRYYGTYGECVVIFTEGQIAVVTDLVLGEQTISHWSSFSIYVCKNGEAYALQDACRNGLLTDKDITLIRQYHNAYNQAYHDWLNSQTSIQ